jgi:hypothetical protein
MNYLTKRAIKHAAKDCFYNTSGLAKCLQIR